MAATNLSFAGNSLQSANILTDKIDHFSIPQKIVNIYALSHANRSSIAYTGYPSKKIVVTGTIIDSSIAALDSRLDTFRAYFLNQDQNLDIDYNGSTRRYIATVNTLSIDRPGGLLYATFSIEFVCTQPFGQDTAATTALTATGRTSSSYSDAYTFLGTAPYQLPVVTVTFTALTGGTAKSVAIGNAGTGETITVTRTWTASDVLVVDCLNQTVTVNGIAVDFTGAFPRFAPGSQSISYADTLTTRTFNITATYNVLYL